MIRGASIPPFVTARRRKLFYLGTDYKIYHELADDGWVSTCWTLRICSVYS
jgi:hypothetical protein